MPLLNCHQKRLLPECWMRFLLRIGLIGSLFALFLVALAIQQHSLALNHKRENHTISGSNNREKAEKAEAPTEEDKEVRRLLLLANPGADEGVPIGSSGQQQAGAVAPQLENAIGAGLIFPIGRYPTGSGIPGGNGQLTLNVVVVLVVSLLSIAVLITAICCVIIIALAMDSATSTNGIDESPSASTDFLLSNWPNLMLMNAQTVPQLEKLFHPSGTLDHHDPSFFANVTPPLTDDEMEEEEEYGQMGRDLEFGCGNGRRHYYHDRYPLMAPMEEEDGGGRSWPAIAWRQFGHGVRNMRVANNSRSNTTTSHSTRLDGGRRNSFTI